MSLVICSAWARIFASASTIAGAISPLRRAISASFVSIVASFASIWCFDDIAKPETVPDEKNSDHCVKNDAANFEDGHRLIFLRRRRRVIVVQITIDLG